jgi:hypothetical protein
MACCGRGTRIRYTHGWTSVRTKALLAWRATVRVEPVGGWFYRRDELLEYLRQGPDSVLPSPTATPVIPLIPRSRWHLTTIRQAVPWLQTYTVSGVLRLLQRYKLRLRSVQVQQYSPDPDYAAKEDHLLACVRQAALQADTCVFLFLDEMGYYR